MMAEGRNGNGLWQSKNGQTGEKERLSTPDRLPRVLEHAEVLCSRVDIRYHTRVDVLSDASYNEPVPITRPSLRRPSGVTEKLVSEIMNKLYSHDKRLNSDLIVSNLALCDPTHDILLVEDSDHYNLLHKAIIFGDLELLELLLDHGVDPNGLKSQEVCGRGHKKCPLENLGALHLAAFVGHNALVNCLLDHGASTSFQMAVHTFPVDNDHFGLQPPIFTSALERRTAGMLLDCGCKPPIFFAILNNQLGTVKDLLHVQGNKTESPTSDNTSWCHLACRFKAYECFEYLLNKDPQAINTKDTYGMYLLEMALWNNMRFIKLLLNHDCDLHILDDIWEPGINILHQLFRRLIFTQFANDLLGLKDVIAECLKRGVEVNEHDSASNVTPLHVLMQYINRIWFDSDLRQPEESYQELLEQMDKELKDCMTALLTYGANIHIKDSEGKTPLEVLILNTNYVIRYKNSRARGDINKALYSPSYGLDNTVECVDMLIALGAMQQDEKLPVIERSVESLISASISTSCKTVNGIYPFQILEENVMFEKYVELLKLLLHAGADPNVATQSKLPPLLSLLQMVDKSDPRNLLTEDTAHRLLRLIHLLIENGANTETDMLDIDGPGRHEVGCFDMLKVRIQEMHKCSSVQTLDVLHTLAIGLIQHGASTNVYENIFELDDIPIEGRADSGPQMHQHTFLYQYLVFGILNLKFVNEGPWYMNVFNVLYCQIEHFLLHDVLAMTQAQFSNRHKHVDCECRHCGDFKLLLDSVTDKPRSLKVLCRLAVKHSVKSRLVFAVPYLPLPHALKSYLLSFQP